MSIHDVTTRHLTSHPLPFLNRPLFEEFPVSMECLFFLSFSAVSTIKLFKVAFNLKSCYLACVYI
jgi:hypothetical protein